MAIRQPWPDRLWLVRHGQSQGNVARDAAHERHRTAGTGEDRSSTHSATFGQVGPDRA